MATLRSLVQSCGSDENTLLSRARSHSAEWERWLEPINATDPAGEDPGYDDDFQRIREEVNKLTDIDTALICRLAETLLLNTSKDLRVIVFYLWARLHQDGELGLAQGIELLGAMLERFGTQLHPRRERSRKTALAWLASSRVTDSLSLYPEMDIAVMQRIIGALLLTNQCLTLFPDDASPALGGLYQVLNHRLIQNGGANSLVPQTSREEDVNRASASNSPAMNTVMSGRDLLDQAKALAKYLSDQPGGWLAGHHLLKSVRWDTLTELPALDGSGCTRLSPPKPDHKAHLKRLYLQKSWSELLGHTDMLLAQGVNHLWLDVQWYTWQALVKLDNDSVRADILCRDLQGLLTRLPGLEAMAFNDGTPFADEVTLSWIQERVIDSAPQWQNEPASSVVAGSDDVLSLEPEVLAKADSEGIEAAFSWLQAQSSYTNARDRWLMRLLMARVAEQKGKNELAQHLLSELDGIAQSMTLTQWAPALLFEVKSRRLRLLRIKATRSETHKSRLQPEMDSLLAGLIALDPASSAVLCGS